MRDRERERKRERDTGRERSRLHAGSPTWDSIQGLSRIMPWAAGGAKLLSHWGCPGDNFKRAKEIFWFLIEARASAQYCAMHRTVPTTKSYLAENVCSTKIEKLVRTDASTMLS